MAARRAGLLVVAVAALLAPPSSAAPRSGGTFVVAEPAEDIDSIDAAVGYLPGDVPLYSTVCASLMHLSDRPLPRGFRATPDIAARAPTVSRDGRTYVFTIRRGLRFSTGAPVTAADVAAAIDRLLDPALKSPWSESLKPIVGAAAVLAGTTTHARGVVASGDRLTVRLSHRVGDFLEGAATSLCVLPAGRPATGQLLAAPVPSAGPYYIAEFVPGRRIVAERNPYYAGPRPHRVDRFVFDLAVDSGQAIDDVISGKADYAWVPNVDYSSRAAELARRFGVNRERFFVQPSAFLRMFVLNTSRPLFRDNLPLRRAVNYAIERTALARLFGPYAGTPVDQFLPPIMPGYANARLYPVGKADLRRARALAKGHTRGGRLVLYVPELLLPQAQVVRQDLARIGLTVVIRSFPPPLHFQKIANPHEPFDMAFVGWLADDPDPGSFLTTLFDGGRIGTPLNQNFSYLNLPRWNGLLRRAARLTGAARDRAFGKLDVELARDVAPAVAFSVDNTLTLVSGRTGCVTVNPSLDLAGVCLQG